MCAIERERGRRYEMSGVSQTCVPRGIEREDMYEVSGMSQTCVPRGIEREKI